MADANKGFPFNELAVEIRLMVWQAALDELGFSRPCVHVLGNMQGTGGWHVSFDPVASRDIDRAAHRNPLMRVNREAREQCLLGGGGGSGARREVVDLLGSLHPQWRRAPVLVDWRRDTVYLDRAFSQMLPDFAGYCPWVPRAQRLACFAWHLCNGDERIVALRRFASLRLLTFLCVDAAVLLRAARGGAGVERHPGDALAIGGGFVRPPSPDDGLCAVDVLSATFGYRSLLGDDFADVLVAAGDGGVDADQRRNAVAFPDEMRALGALKLRYAIDFGRRPPMENSGWMNYPRYKRMSSEYIDNSMTTVSAGGAGGDGEQEGPKTPQFLEVSLGTLVRLPDPQPFGNDEDAYYQWRDAASAVLSGEEPR